MKSSFYTFLFLLSFLFSCQTAPEQPIACDVLVLGEGTGAVAAALQAARSEAQTILINPQPWLGGMLTSAGVSAIDGNHRLPAGLWGEFRQHLRDHYGGADSLFTGWVSNTMFEPKIGAQIWLKMTQPETLLDVWTEAKWTAIQKEDQWLVSVRKKDGTEVSIKSKILIDGTDLGDVAAAVGVRYDLGMEARTNTGEAMAPEKAHNIIQDLTYAAILKDYGEQADKTIPQPLNYSPEEFQCACRYQCEDETAHPCETMLTYGLLPNDKYMINWPIVGNDYYANVLEMSEQERAQAYEKAKQKTLRFIYFIQKDLGFKNLGLAEDEFPTEDLLPLMPYHREGRRILGLNRLNVNHLLQPYDFTLYRTGIAVGDYPIDHHHDENPAAPEIDFPPVPSFNIPAGCLIPQNVDHLLVADKPISVSNIVNGSSRLQPVILQIGQAAGLMGAMAARQNKKPAELDLREVQNNLIQARAYLLPLIDVEPDDLHFAAIQRVAATGLLRAKGIPFKWANQTWFYPDTSIHMQQLLSDLRNFDIEMGRKLQSQMQETEKNVSISDASQLIYGMIQFFDLYSDDFSSATDLKTYIQKNWSGLYQLENYQPDRPITKMELAVLLDQIINPFHLKKVNFDGQWLTDS